MLYYFSKYIIYVHILYYIIDAIIGFVHCSDFFSDVWISPYLIR